MTYYIYHMYMDVHRYVCVDVPSVYTVHGMTYYIHHKNTDVHQCVCVDVSSDYPVH